MQRKRSTYSKPTHPEKASTPLPSTDLGLTWEEREEQKRLLLQERLTQYRKDVDLRMRALLPRWVVSYVERHGPTSFSMFLCRTSASWMGITSREELGKDMRATIFFKRGREVARVTYDGRFRESF
jgi:hypothetical protein